MASKYIRVQGNVGESPFFAKYFDMFEIKHLVFIMNSFLSTFVYYCTLLCSGHFQFIFFMKDVASVLTNLEPFTALIRPPIAIDRKNEILKNLNFKDV